MLFLHHSNDLDRLGDRLIELLETSPRGALEAETVVLQNPGMKRWLQQRLSGSTGIAANIEFPLPSRFVWDLYSQEFDAAGIPPELDAEVMRWRLLDLLRNNSDQPELRDLAAYLHPDEDGRAGFQLADRLARLFDHYQVYRPDMIDAWWRGQEPLSHDQRWQAWLWRNLGSGHGGEHRGSMLLRLVNKLAAAGGPGRDSETGPVHVFGLSSLSPLYLNVLAALSLCCDVHFYLLNPSRHYWGDIQSLRERLRSGQQAPADNDLLASLGKQGREFIDQLYSLPVDFDDEDFQVVEIPPQNRLQRLQYAILNLEAAASLPPELAGDQSIQVVSCYSELRELQVLHDRLLGWLEDDPTLELDDIVVMCPDIGRMTPYIDAVFGDRDCPGHLPYAISDHNPLADDALIGAILEWVRLPLSRLSASEVLGWLELPALQRAVSISESDLEQIRYWVTHNHVHWGADEGHKREAGFGGGHLYSWHFGINRLLSAYLLRDGISRFGEQAPADDLPGQHEFELLGRLQGLIDLLVDLAGRFKRPATMSEWRKRINHMLERLCRAEDAEELRLARLREALAELEQQTLLAGYEEQLDYRLLHDLLEQSLQRHNAGHQYLGGGINFCNLIPMRSLPFRIVCLVGLDDAGFPRRDPAEQFDLIARQPRKGDRSRRDDDRYMFLQSLVSARDIFYLSYVGRDKRDDSEIQPSVLIRELLDHVEQAGAGRVVIEDTALQPFSAKNFSQGSFAAHWALDPEKQQRAPFRSVLAPMRLEDDIELDSLTWFFRNPPRWFMQQRLHLSLRESVDVAQDEELFTLDNLQRYDLAQHLLRDLIEGALPDRERYTHSGMLSEFYPGKKQFEDQLCRVQPLVERLKSHPQYHRKVHFDGRLSLANANVYGQVDSYSESGLLRVYAAELTTPRLLDSWIQYCFCSVSASPGFCEIVSLKKDKVVVTAFKALPRDQAQAYLEQLVELFLRGWNEALEFYPDTALRYVNNKRAADDENIARRDAQEDWLPGARRPCYESQDRYIRTAMRNADHGPGQLFGDEFYQLAERILAPVLDGLESGQ